MTRLRGYAFRDVPTRARINPSFTPRSMVRTKSAVVVQRRYRKYSAKKSTTLKKFVDKRIDAANPDHWIRQEIAWTGIQGIPFVQTSGNPSGVFQVIPKIYQVGAALQGGQVQQATIESREGNQVHLKNITINLNLVMSPTYGDTDPAHAGIRYRVIIFTCKKYSQYNDTINNFFDTTGSDNLEQSLLRDGADGRPWDSYMQNFDLPVNTEMFTVHAQRTGKLDRGVAIGDSTGSTTRMPMPNVTLKMPLKVKSKKLLYNEPNEALPSNFNPILWVGYKAYDGTALHSGNYIHVVGNSVIQFEDH